MNRKIEKNSGVENAQRGMVMIETEVNLVQNCWYCLLHHQVVLLDWTLLNCEALEGVLSKHGQAL